MEQYLRITRREREVILSLVNGLTNKQIAQQLGISKYTIRDHLSSIFEKMDVTSRIELAVLVVGMKENLWCAISK
ncbi:response regulator transcription factor [Pseudomonas sp. GM79]|uniref:response regulator transcription factor n=1 Tax=Pseudomonas sp. GM79 TaxID=1144338 RepID=UPI000518FF3B|nr:LuxR C-terminal-related transcriptional regulator [Pseudomonas sp. GM79]